MLGAGFKKRLLLGNISNREEHLFTFFISLLCMTVYIASDVFLPSLPEMTTYFKTTVAISQSTLSVFMIGLSSTQILHGLLADRFGKRTILLIVLPLFLLSTLGCIFASTIHILIIFRAFQAISASACVVIGRSLFSDLFDPKRAQRAFAVLVPLVSLSPAIAPAIGGFLATHFDWRASFVFVFIFTFVVSFFVLFYLPESKPIEKRMKSIHFKIIFSSLFQMLFNVEFIKSALSLFMTTISWWYYVTGSPLMFHKLGLTPDIIGILYFPAVLPYILSAFLARKMLITKTPKEIFEMGNKFLFLSAFIMPLFFITYHLNIFIIILAMNFITASNGFVVSMSMAAGIAQFKHQSGLAAGLLGTIQLLAGALASLLTGVAGERFDLQYFCWFVFSTVMACYLAYGMLCFWGKKRELASE